MCCHLSNSYEMHICFWFTTWYVWEIHLDIFYSNGSDTHDWRISVRLLGFITCQPQKLWEGKSLNLLNPLDWTPCNKWPPKTPLLPEPWWHIGFLSNTSINSYPVFNNSKKVWVFLFPQCVVRLAIGHWSLWENIWEITVLCIYLYLLHDSSIRKLFSKLNPCALRKRIRSTLEIKEEIKSFHCDGLH